MTDPPFLKQKKIKKIFKKFSKKILKKFSKKILKKFSKKIFFANFQQDSFEITWIMQKSAVLHSYYNFLVASQFLSCFIVFQRFSRDFSRFLQKIHEFFTNSRLRLEFAKSYAHFLQKSRKIS